MAKKRKTGTREWAESNYNIGIGCAHDCKYCYARTSAVRYKQVESDAAWTTEKFKDKMPPITKKQGWIMFPTTHDITPFYLPMALVSLSELLAKGNKVLIVSKPHLECVAAMCRTLEPFKDNVLFRFTIGGTEEHAKFWEPGAPSIKERLACLEFAFKEGYATSVSMEPMLGTVEETLNMFNLMAPHVTDKIWIGKMNQIDRRVVKVDDNVIAKCEEVMANQSNGKIMWLVNQLFDHPKIAWKDSIKEIIEAHENNRLDL